MLLITPTPSLYSCTTQPSADSFPLAVPAANVTHFNNWNSCAGRASDLGEGAGEEGKEQAIQVLVEGLERLLLRSTACRQSYLRGQGAADRCGMKRVPLSWSQATIRVARSPYVRVVLAREGGDVERRMCAGAHILYHTNAFGAMMPTSCSESVDVTQEERPQQHILPNCKEFAAIGRRSHATEQTTYLAAEFA